VGLRMAALAIRDHADPAAFVESFHGNHRYITSYLVDETFAHLPRTIQRFLLRTSNCN
jgi:LuxR family maltose regulon positive regulatory protein